jgi:glycosyltransferase involved in cell wall biosynthesis
MLEVIVVDDGSTDGTGEAVEAIGDPRVRYVAVSHGGVSCARNRGIAEAKGDFVLWLDSDDRLAPGAIDAYLRVLEAEPQADILYGQWVLVDEKLQETGRRTFVGYAPQDMLPAMIHGCTVPQGGAMIRRSCFDRVGSFDEDLPYAEDYDFYARAVEHCRFRAVDEVVYLCRSHDDHLCGHDNATDRLHERKVVNRIVEKYGYEAVFPDLYKENGENAEAGCLFRMAAIMYQRGGADDGAALFERALVGAGQRPDESTGREAGRFLYQIALIDRDLYRHHTQRCADAMPESRLIRKHQRLAALPTWIHRRIRSVRK